MTAFSFCMVLLSEICSVAGQIFFKHAMCQPPTASRVRFAGMFGAGIATKAVAFFVWLGLLSKFELSYLYPFEGLSPILLVIGAAVFLGEKMTLSLWLGVILISGGVALVSAS